MVQKILMLVSSCGECPNHSYCSGDKNECTAVHEIVEDKSSIAPFCPLVDFPSRTIANMDRTIQTLREPNKYGMVIAILSHIATKLKVNMDAYGINIPTKNDGDIYLFHEAIINVKTFPCSVCFTHKDRKFKLLPDGDKPQLHEMVVRPELPDREFWKEIYLE